MAHLQMKEGEYTATIYGLVSQTDQTEFLKAMKFALNSEIHKKKIVEAFLHPKRWFN